MEMANVREVPYPLTAAAVPGTWRSWLVPLVVGAFLVSFLALQVDSCFEQGEPKIPAHSDKPMKD